MAPVLMAVDVSMTWVRLYTRKENNSKLSSGATPLVWQTHPLVSWAMKNEIGI
jgi:hypothetical protein